MLDGKGLGEIYVLEDSIVVKWRWNMIPKRVVSMSGVPEGDYMEVSEPKGYFPVRRSVEEVVSMLQLILIFCFVTTLLLLLVMSSMQGK